MRHGLDVGLADGLQHCKADDRSHSADTKYVVDQLFIPDMLEAGC